MILASLFIFFYQLPHYLIFLNKGIITSGSHIFLYAIILYLKLIDNKQLLLPIPINFHHQCLLSRWRTNTGRRILKLIKESKKYTTNIIWSKWLYKILLYEINFLTIPSYCQRIFEFPGKVLLNFEFVVIGQIWSGLCLSLTHFSRWKVAHKKYNTTPSRSELMLKIQIHSTLNQTLGRSCSRTIEERTYPS